MRVIFKTIEINNFMSFEKEIFNFEKMTGLNLICGKNFDIPGSKNGTGKSTIFNALCFGLFGEIPNKIKNENIRNKYTNIKEVSVIVYFSVENINYKIISGFNKYKNAFCNLFKIKYDKEKEILEEITKSTIIETHKYLETEILKFNMSIFLRTILLTSDNQYNFFRLKKQEKKEFIEKLFDISIFGEMFSAIHKDIIQEDKKILSIENKLIILNKTSSDFISQIENYKNEKQKKINNINKNLKKLIELKNKLLSVEIKSNEIEAKKFEDDSNILNNKILEFEKKSSQINNQLNKIDLKINSINQKIKYNSEKIEQFSELLKKLCDNCKPIIKQYYNISLFENEIIELNKDLEKLQLNKNKYKQAKNLILNNIKTLQEKLNLIIKKIHDLTWKFNKFQNDLIKLETNINIENKNKKNIEQEENPYINLFEKNKKELDENNKILDEIKNNYKYLKFAENIVSQDTLKKFIIKDLIYLLNNKILFYLNKLGANYSCIFDENMNYTFKTLGGFCEYDSFSSGERMRLNIAVSFAFRDFMATRSNLISNILILDEYIDSNIDSLAIDGIIEILKEYILIYNQNIFVISHRKEIDNSIFKNIIQVQKKNNISLIKYIN